MSVYKLSDLLYKSKGHRICLADTDVNVKGPKGIISLSRPSSTSTTVTPSKYSMVGLILDAFFLHNSITGLQTDDAIYTRFEYKGKVYEAFFNGDNISWASPEPEGFAMLIPIVVYVLSDLYKGDNADELKGYFNDIKDTKKDKYEVPSVKQSVLLFCDAFYFGYAKQVNTVASFPNEIARSMITQSFEKGALKEIPILSGLSKDIELLKPIDPIPKEENKEEIFKVKYDKWTEEQMMNIPAQNIMKNFVMTPKTISIAKKINFRLNRVIDRMNAGKEGVEAIGPDYINILMVGRPATGKSALATAVAAMTGMPIYTIPFSKHTEEDTAEGKNKVVDGKIGFVETDFLKAYEHGGIIVCEEINLADPGVVMGSLGQAIEKPFILMKDGYKPIRRHPLCVIIGTMNTGTAGSKQLNQALSSRFKCTYVLDDPDKATFIDILASQGYPKKTCRYVYDAYSKIIKFLKSPEQSQEELCDNITLRGCFGALESIEEGEDAKEAIKNSLVGKIAEVDLETARQVEKMLVEILPDRI